VEFSRVLELFEIGKTIDEKEATVLEISLESNPNDVFSRIKLIGYYAPRRRMEMSNYVRHLAWIIDNYPDGEIADLAVNCKFDKGDDAYEQLRVCWLQQSESESATIMTILNAADFFLVNRDTQLAFACLRRFEKLQVQPSKNDYLRLSRIYKQLSEADDLHGEGPSRETVVGESMRWCAKASQLENDGREFYASTMLLDLLFGAGRLADAKHAAKTLLTRASDNPAIHGYAIHVANIVLGKIALAEDRRSMAAKHLLASVEVPDSDLFASKRPDMSLARTLLETGDTQVVLEFIALCERFTLAAPFRRQLDRWREAIADRRLPD
jgi:hypothetical protein